MFRKITAAAAIACILASPVHAANPAASLSLSASDRIGQELDEESDLFGSVLGSIVSGIGLALLTAYIVIEITDEGDVPTSA